MRRTVTLVTALLALLAPRLPADAGLGDAGTFRIWLSMSSYPCNGCSAAHTSGSFRQYVSGPDFDSAWDDGWVASSDCVVGTAQFVITAAPTDPGWNRGTVYGVASWVGAYAVVTAEFNGWYASGPYAGVGAVVATPSGLAVGGLVDACDGFGPAVPATVQLAGTWVSA